MSIGFFVIFSTALCALCLFLPCVQSIYDDVFDGFNGERICTDPETKYNPAIYCQRMNPEATWDCMSLNLAMKKEVPKPPRDEDEDDDDSDEDAEYYEWDLYSREIVACLDEGVIIGCVSGARKDKYYLEWEYYYPPRNAVPNAQGELPSEKCHSPVERKSK